MEASILSGSNDS